LRGLIFCAERSGELEQVVASKRRKASGGGSTCTSRSSMLAELATRSWGARVAAFLAQARRVGDTDPEIQAQIDLQLASPSADKELRELVKATGTTLMDLHGIGPSDAARLLVAVGDITRFPDRAARPCAASNAGCPTSSTGT
jgi:hypothetical protein